MDMSYGEESGTDLATMRGRDYPGVRQFSVFLHNRVGSLLDLVRRLEDSGNRIVALSVVDSAECAVVRLILSEPERAVETLTLAKLPFLESDLLLVQLPQRDSPVAKVCKALLAAEINIHYAYPVMASTSSRRQVLAIHVENHESACLMLQNQGFTVLSEGDLEY
jgi:hypothetical protein